MNTKITAPRRAKTAGRARRGGIAAIVSAAVLALGALLFAPASFAGTTPDDSHWTLTAVPNAAHTAVVVTGGGITPGGHVQVTIGQKGAQSLAYYANVVGNSEGRFKVTIRTDPVAMTPGVWEASMSTKTDILAKTTFIVKKSAAAAPIGNVRTGA